MSLKKYSESEIARLIEEIFDNRYNILGHIGKGGMGSVFLVESNDQFRLQRALKIIEKSDQDIYTEVEALKTLNHPGIPKVIEVLETDEFFFIIQEYIKGKSLRQVIEENSEIPQETTMLWMSDIADILSYLHKQGFIHRDIKPTNIMITENGEIKIIDFGIAKNINDIDEIDRQVIGTRNYTAPERYNKRPADRRSDIYGFGSTCYYLATGSVPLEVTTNSRKPLKVMIKNLQAIEPKGLRNVISKCLDINPDKRYQNFDEIRYQLKQVNAFDEIIERSQAKQKQQLTAILLLFITGLLTIVAGFFVYNYEQRRHYNELITTAEDYYNSAQYSEAKQAYAEAINQNSKRLTGYQGIFETNTKLGDYQQIVTEAAQLFSNNPDANEDPNILYLVGNAYYELGEYAQAQNYLSKAVELDPTIENHLVLGLNYSAQGQYDKAQQVISDLQAMGGDVNTSTYLSGQISNLQGNKDEAIRAFNQVIASTSDSSLKQKALRSLSSIYKENKNYTALIQTLESAMTDPVLANDLQLNELMAEAYYNQGSETNNIEQLRASADKFRTVLELGNNQAYIYRNLAIIYQNLGQYDQAYSVLDRLEEEYPANAIANIQRAWLELEYQAGLNESERDYSEFTEEMNKAKSKDDGSNSGEIQRLEQLYSELIAKGWIGS